MKKRVFCVILTVLMCVTMLTGCGHEHVWTEASCTMPKSCTECGEVEGEAIGHVWTEATCTEPKTCTVCAELDGMELGHELTEATYQSAPSCTRCGETVGVPLEADFELYGIAVNAVEVGKTYDYHTTTNDPNIETVGKTTISSYEVIESDELREAREGYQWHVVTFETVFADENVMQTGVSVDYTCTNYYDIAGFKDTADHSDASVSVYTVNYNGEEVPVYFGQSGGFTPNDDGTLTFELVMSVQVPVGYDGVVIGLNNGTVDARVENYLFNVYNAEDFLLFRIQG